jgi:hypothetical protein
MRAYVAVTGVLFVLISGLHVVRVFAEPNMARDPFFILTTVIGVGMAFWALTVFRRSAQS